MKEEENNILKNPRKPETQKITKFTKASKPEEIQEYFTNEKELERETEWILKKGPKMLKIEKPKCLQKLHKYQQKNHITTVCKKDHNLRSILPCS